MHLCEASFWINGFAKNPFLGIIDNEVEFMIDKIKSRLEEVMSSEGTVEEKERSLIDYFYEIMKDDELVFEEAKAEIDSVYNKLKETTQSNHIQVQLDNEYRQAVRNFNKQLDRVEFQRKGKAEKEEILASMEELKAGGDFKSLTRTLYNFKDDWEDAAYAGKDYDAQLNTQFKELFDEMMGAKDKYYDDMNVNRQSAKEQKEDLVKRAVEAAKSTRWKETSQVMKSLMDEWKQSGNAGKEDNDLLWEQFNGARQEFFQNQEQYFDELHVRQAESLKVKESLIEQAEAICDSEDFKETAQVMRDLMNQWKKAGSAGRDVEDSLWEKFQGAREKFYSRQKEYYDQKKGKFMDNLYEGIKRRNKQISDLEAINKDLEAQINEIHRMDPVLGNQEDRWEITNQRNQEVAKLQTYVDENLKKIHDLREQLKEMDEKYTKLED